MANQKITILHRLDFLSGTATGNDDAVTHRTMADQQFPICISAGFVAVYRIHPEPPVHHAFHVCREKTILDSRHSHTVYDNRYLPHHPLSDGNPVAPHATYQISATHS